MLRGGVLFSSRQPAGIIHQGSAVLPVRLGCAGVFILSDAAWTAVLGRPGRVSRLFLLWTPAGFLRRLKSSWQRRNTHRSPALLLWLVEPGAVKDAVSTFLGGPNANPLRARNGLAHFVRAMQRGSGGKPGVYPDGGSSFAGCFVI